MTLDTPQRRYDLLFRAMNDVLDVLAADGDERRALEASFAAAAQGFGAANALLLLVEQDAPPRLRCLASHGSLTPAQVRACEQGLSIAGVSPSVITRAIATRDAELIEDPRARQGALRTSSLAGGEFSVLCAPVCDVARQATLAVLYFQNGGLRAAYRESDLAWLRGYATALGRVFSYHFEAARRRATTPVPDDDAPELVGDSSHMQALRRELHTIYVPSLAAERPDPILVLGERGTGKDLVARYLHACSARRERPFVVANCAEISDELAAARFLGHRRGAFTGALADEPGFFRAAHRGVLFLDEIGDLSARAQGTLLRVLENHALTPVGETREVPVDVAVLLATNRDLEDAVRTGALRADFYDRFRAQSLHLEPLRARPWDVPALLEHFRRQHERRTRKRTLGFTPEALRLLASYPWPGNVRELARTCSHMVTRANAGAVIDAGQVRAALPQVDAAEPNPRVTPALWEGARMDEALGAFRRELILARLERFGGHVRQARESLGLSRTTFYRQRLELGIPLSDDDDE